jgi:tetrahydromethanopterin S-methyltransferase subunit G
MDLKALAIKEKIDKLSQKLQNIEEKHERTVSKLIKDVSKKGVDIRILTGMIINSESVLKSFEKELGAWRDAGDKFLFKSKSKSPPSKDRIPKK